jgi:hypothetical protein
MMADKSIMMAYHRPFQDHTSSTVDNPHHVHVASIIDNYPRDGSAVLLGQPACRILVWSDSCLIWWHARHLAVCPPCCMQCWTCGCTPCGCRFRPHPCVVWLSNAYRTQCGHLNELLATVAHEGEDPAAIGEQGGPHNRVLNVFLLQDCSPIVLVYTQLA